MYRTAEHMYTELLYVYLSLSWLVSSFKLSYRQPKLNVDSCVNILVRNNISLALNSCDSVAGYYVATQPIDVPLQFSSVTILTLVNTILGKHLELR